MTPPSPRYNDLRQRLPVGTVLDGVYEIEGEIGSGGFGITYRGRDTRLGHAVAIKEYFPSDIGNRDSTMSVHPASQAFGQVFTWGRDGFVREAQMLAGFRHPNIVRVLRYFEANNTAYMALEYEEGQSFSRWLDRLGGPPTQADLDRITNGLCDALALIHEKRLMHRDIAPDNVIVRPDGSPVLLDFGAARYEAADQTRASGRSAHTTSFAIIKAHYSPFEQRSTDTTKRGPWSDIYALGATLYRAVVGAVPMDAADRMAGDSDTLAPAVEAAVGRYRPTFLEAIDKALSIKPGDRPQTIAAFRALAFRGAATATGANAPPEARSAERVVPHKVLDFGDLPDQRPRTDTPARRGMMAPVAAAALALLIGLGAMAWWTGGRVEDRSAASIGLVTRPQPDVRTGPTAPADATQERAKAEADAETLRRTADARQRAEQQRAEQLAAAERHAAEVRSQREEAERTAAAARRAEESRRLEEETARLRRANEQARLEQTDLDRRRAEDEARVSRAREVAAQEALERERTARAAADARAAAVARPPVAPQPPAPAYIERRANFSAKGEGYSTTRNSSYAQCEAQCLGDVACQSFEFYQPQSKCNLYANVPLDGASKDADVGIKRQGTAPVTATAVTAVPSIAVAGRIARQANRFLEGDGYRKINASSFHACESLCLADARCKAIELHRKGNVCQLYATVPKSGPTNDADVGVKQ